MPQRASRRVQGRLGRLCCAVLLASVAQALPAAELDPGCSREVFEHAGKRRTYLLCVPSSRPAAPLAVVLGFHGGGGRARTWYERMPWHELGAEHGFVVVYMQGCRDATADCSREEGRYSWNVDKPGTASTVDDEGYVKEVIARLETVHGLAIDRNRLFGTGHSLGGIFVYSLACDLPGLFAAIGPISAPPTDGSCEQPGATSIYHVHGTVDPNVPFDTGCCSEPQKNRDGAQHLERCDQLPLCRNPVNWWPPVRSGDHPHAQVAGLDAIALRGLGCSGALRVVGSTDTTTECHAYDGCERGGAEICLIREGDHSLTALDDKFDIRGYLWSKFDQHGR